VDTAVDCATRGDSINQALQMTRSAGRAVITGVPSEIRYPIEFHTIRKKELQFHTVRRSNHTGAPALKMLSEHLKRFAPMVTHQRTIKEIQPTFEMIEKYSDQVSKAVICPAS
jgi:threonine dehydrogenase-like Zn-dependent dehydrogenase